MAEPLAVELVSPEAVTYSGTAEMVIVRTMEEGDIAFQPGHVAFLGVLAPWSVDVVRPDGGRDRFAVHRGFVEVNHNQVTILSDMSEESHEIDVERASEAQQRAEAALASNPDDQIAAGALERAQLRLRVAAS